MKTLSLLSATHRCELLIVSRDSEWAKQDRDIISINGLPNNVLQLGRKPLFPWLAVTIMHETCRILATAIYRNIRIAVFASNKSSILLWRFLRSRQNIGYDLLLGHGAGALYPTWYLAKRNQIPFVFDVEDYHPGEFIRFNEVAEKKRREFLMQKLLPEAALVTYASPMIGEYSLKLVGENRIKNHLLINNSFKSLEFRSRGESLLTSNFRPSSKLCFVWFSQNVDYGRGLEELMNILDNFSSQIQLHLIGNVRDQFKREVLDERKYIKFHGMMSQINLHKALSLFDIGLAVESRSQDLNRDICLTNKIWAYLQAGLYILASDTKAQRQFLIEKSWAGELTNTDIGEMNRKISELIKNKDIIRAQADERFHRAKQFGWEREGDELKKVISALFKN